MKRSLYAATGLIFAFCAAVGIAATFTESGSPWLAFADSIGLILPARVIICALCASLAFMSCGCFISAAPARLGSMLLRKTEINAGDDVTDSERAQIKGKVGAVGIVHAGAVFSLFTLCAASSSVTAVFCMQVITSLAHRYTMPPSRAFKLFALAALCLAFFILTLCMRSAAKELGRVALLYGASGTRSRVKTAFMTFYCILCAGIALLGFAFSVRTRGCALSTLFCVLLACAAFFSAALLHTIKKKVFPTSPERGNAVYMRDYNK